MPAKVFLFAVLACSQALPMPDGIHGLPLSQPLLKSESEGYPPYTPPANTYQAPQSTYQAPVSTYEAPQATYQAPVSTYEAPQSTYQAPTPTYQAPQPTYQAPAPTYEAPQSSYQAPLTAPTTVSTTTPAPTTAPQSSYAAPQPTYEVPQQGYAPAENVVPVQIHYDYSFNAIGGAKPSPGADSGYASAQGYAPPQNTYQAPQDGYAPAQTGYVSQGYDVPVQVSFDQTVLTGETAGEQEGYAPAQGYEQESNVDSPPKYHFLYTVNDQAGGDVKGHEESRDGEFAQGQYYVLQPDGKIRTVTYHTDDWGFKADVTYS